MKMASLFFALVYTFQDRKSQRRFQIQTHFQCFGQIEINSDELVSVQFIWFSIVFYRPFEMFKYCKFRPNVRTCFFLFLSINFIIFFLSLSTREKRKAKWSCTLSNYSTVDVNCSILRQRYYKIVQCTLNLAFKFHAAFLWWRAVPASQPAKEKSREGNIFCFYIPFDAHI